MDMIFCWGCGKEIQENATICQLCNAPQTEDNKSAKPLSNNQLLHIASRQKSGLLSVILSLFFPGAGYLYCGRIIKWFLAMFILLLVSIVIGKAGVSIMFVLFIIDSYFETKRYNDKLKCDILERNGIKSSS